MNGEVRQPYVFCYIAFDVFEELRTIFYQALFYVNVNYYKQFFRLTKNVYAMYKAILSHESKVLPFSVECARNGYTSVPKRFASFRWHSTGTLAHRISQSKSMKRYTVIFL